MRTKGDIHLAAAAILMTSHVGHADIVPREARDPKSVFLIAKSHNKNQVHYGVKVDEACHVVGHQPVYGYWRMFENKGEIEPMLPAELPAYGVDAEQHIERTSESTMIRIRLNAIPDRSLVITVSSAGGRCQALVTTSIAGADAHLRFIYVRLAWPFGIDYVLLRGSLPDGRTIEEKL